MLPALASYLPYWATRTVDTNSGPLAVFVLVDGTIVAGFRAAGVDIPDADTAALNGMSSAIGTALNLLPKDTWVQTEWRTGYNYDDVCDQLENRGMGALPVLAELRRSRAKALRRDPGLIRGRLTYYVGHSKALGLLGPHSGPAPIWTRAIDALTGKARKDPYSITTDDFVRAAAGLAEVAQRFASELGAAGMKLTPLSEEELIGEVFAAINPYTAKTMPTPAIVDTPEELARLDGQWAVFRPVTLREQLALGDLAWSTPTGHGEREDHFVLDDPPVLHRMMSLQKLPAETTPLLMSRLQFATSAPMRLVTTLQATDRAEIEEKLTKQRNQLQVHSSGMVEDMNANAAFRATSGTLRGIVERGERIFISSMYVCVSGMDHEELDLSTRLLKSAFSEIGGGGTTETQRQLFSWVGALPANGFASPRTYTLPTSNAAHFFPYCSPSLGDTEAQIVWHTSRETLRKLSFVDARRTSKNAMVLGATGKGKTFLLNHIVQNAALADGGPVVILDVQGGAEADNSNRVLCDVLGGRYISLQSDKSVCFNPFKPHADMRNAEGKPDPDERHYIKQLVGLMAFSDLETHPEKPLILNIADACIMEAYSRTAKRGTPPLLEEVVAIMNEYQPDDAELVPLVRTMARRLDRGWLRDDRRAALLNRHTNYGEDTKLLVYDFFGVARDQELATVLFFAVANSIWTMLARYPRSTMKFVIFDEAWQLLTNRTASSLLKELYKTGRKWGAATWSVTQSIDDFVNSPVADAVIANSPNVLLLQHEDSQVPKTAHILNLSPPVVAQLAKIRSVKGKHSDVLVIESGRPAVLQFRPIPAEIWLNTTEPQDLALRRAVMAERGLSLAEAIKYLAERYPNGAEHGAR